MSNVTDSMSNRHGTLAKGSENQSSLPDSGVQQAPLCSHSYTRILLRKTFWNFITNLLHNVMEGPFFLPVIILQPESIFIKDSSKVSGHRNCKGRGETEYRGFFSTAVSMTMTSVDLPRQPTYPSLDFYSYWFGAY